MSLSEGDSELPEDPFGRPGDSEPGGVEEDVEKPFNFLNLRNTTPEDALQQVQGQVDFEAEWYEHIAAMLLKQSSGEGVEAWVHGVIAIVIFVRQAQEAPEEPGEAVEEEQAEGYSAPTEETYDLGDIFE